jgi:hypothetical protein
VDWFSEVADWWPEPPPVPPPPLFPPPQLPPPRCREDPQ